VPFLDESAGEAMGKILHEQEYDLLLGKRT
jgi:hypothetical protein